jgi:ABC-type multidrug transport system fused ATPase/permease subunit
VGPPSLSRLIALLRPRRGAILLAAGLAALVALLSGASVGILKPAVEALFDRAALAATLDRVREAAPLLAGPAEAVARAAEEDPLRALGILLAAVFVLAVIRGLLRWAHETLVATAAQGATADLLDRTFASLLRQDVGHLQRTGAASYLSRFTADADAVSKGLETLAGSLVFEPLAFAAYAGLAFLLSWKLALLSVVAAPLLAFVVRRVSRAVRESTRRVLEKRQGLTTRVEETLRGIRVVQAYGGEAAEAGRFGAVNARVFAEFRRLARLEAATGPALEVVAIVGIAGALLAGGALAVRGEVTLGDLFAIFAALAGMYAPLRKIGGAVNRVQGALAGAARIFEAADRPPAVGDAPDARALPAGPGAISLRGVSVRYPDGASALEGVSLEVPAGARLAVLGPSGSGKSTLLNLLPRFLDPDRGTVAVDGADLRGLSLASLRSACALVPQEVFLHEGTVRENVLYGRPGATAEEVEAACRAARVAEFAERLPGGLDAPVGPAGALLSGGERQRVAVARALLRDPRIVLLDEPTASLDARNEALVDEALERLARGRTTILVTHRAAAAARADLVLVLDRGRVAGIGTHAALLDSCPLYRALAAGPGSGPEAEAPDAAAAAREA